MKIKELIEEDTVAGAIAGVSMPFFRMNRRRKSRGLRKESGQDIIRRVMPAAVAENAVGGNLVFLGQVVKDENDIRDAIAQYLKIEAPTAVEGIRGAIDKLTDRPQTRVVKTVLNDLAMITRKFRLPLGRFHHEKLQHFVESIEE